MAHPLRSGRLESWAQVPVHALRDEQEHGPVDEHGDSSQPQRPRQRATNQDEEPLCPGAPLEVGKPEDIPALALDEAPLRRAGVLPGGAEGNGEGGAEADVWVNSVVVNDYRKDGFISPHIDPPHVRRSPAQKRAATAAAQFIHACDHMWPHSFPRGTGVRASDRLALALLRLRARIRLLLLMAAARHPRAENIAEVAERHLGRPRGASATWRGVRALGCGGGRLGALREAG